MEIIETKEGKIHSSPIEEYTKEWLKNNNFSGTENPWKSKIIGDSTDISATFTPGQVNYNIFGEERTFSKISGTPLLSEWTKVHNPEFPAYPDDSNITPEGCWATHSWYEASDQSPSVHWDRNITMPVDMSDYIITSASLTAIVNATVTAYPGSMNTSPQGWGVETPGDDTGPYQDDNDQFFTGDYVRFYVLLSDLTKEKEYEVSYNQTSDLGKDSAGSYDYMSDTFTTTVSEEDLIFYLTSVLSSDYRNFTITLGIRIWCEDNWWSDRDRWDDLLIKSCNLTFTYQKKVNQFTTASWYQKGNTISGENVQIIDGNLRFKYKINQNWPTSLSPNSELQIFINNNTLLESVKLSTANLSFTEAKKGGFDMTYLLLKDVNISLYIKLFLADEFPLVQNLTLSITDVFLQITYTVFTPETEEEPWLYAGLFIIAAIAAAVISGLLIAYVKVWRFPIPIRKLRKHRKALPSERDPNVMIISREAAFRSSFHKEAIKTSKFLKGPPFDGKIEKEKLFRKEA
ncbi:MAG: hypothetical protein ACFE78_07490 [Candidatus Hodarchaeota archaeon]